MSERMIQANPVDPRAINRTHDPHATSWVAGANDPLTDFPVQNLPYGCFTHPNTGMGIRIGVAIGDQVLDLVRAESALNLPDPIRTAIHSASDSLNPLMSLDLADLAQLRETLFNALSGDTPPPGVPDALLSRAICTMRLPAKIGDYSDFFTSRHHAANAARIFRRPDPLPENYHYLPIAYHGRTSSIRVSGTPVQRPFGQWLPATQSAPVFAPSKKMDYEVEVAAFVRGGTESAQRLSVAQARDSIFGLVLQNDWSARDIQSWENKPLGPFLSKSFATTISPWVVTTFALAPFRSPLADRETEIPLPTHLWDADDATWQVSVTCEIARRGLTDSVTRLSAARTTDLHWTFEQMLAHHSSNGCPMVAGDLFGSGTISGASDAALGCLLELTENGAAPVTLSDGSLLRYLNDGDVVTFHGRCEAEGYRGIGFGTCTGEVRPATQ
jgi:fumarylacetoacetase